MAVPTRVTTGNTAVANDLNQLIDLLEGAASLTEAFKLVSTTGENFIVKLSDAAGIRKFSIQDSAGVEVASINSDGAATFSSVSSTSTLVLPTSTTPTPTTEGQIAWDSDDHLIAVGDAAATQLFYPGRSAKPHLLAPVHGLGTAAVARGALTPNRAYLVPLTPLTQNVTVTALMVELAGSTDSIDVGIYTTTDFVTFTRVVSSGALAFPGTSLQHLDIVDTALTQGTRYFFAVAVNGATLTISQISDLRTGGVDGSSAGVALGKATSYPLPTTITSPTIETIHPCIGGVISGEWTFTS